jgi:V/A-type H+-transporting ATPase subunit C
MAAGSVSGYAAVNAQVRIMYSDLLPTATLVRLSETPDLGALARALKETAYEPYLDGVEDKSLTPRRMDYQVKGRLADNYLSLIRAVPSEQARPLLIQLYRHFEVDNLKAVLRGIVSDSSWELVRYVLFPLGSFTVLPAREMVEAGSVEAAVALLSQTPYYATLSHAMERYTAEQSLFPLEVSLDLNYWRELWEDMTRLSGQDREHALRIIGALVDTTNLMWAIRYRVYHNLAEEEVINYTLPFGHHVKDDDIRAIAAGAEIVQVVSRLYPDLPNVEVLLQAPQTGLPQLELQLQRHVADECRAAFVGYPFHVGIPLAYLILNELEIQDLTVLFEAKAAGMLVEDFRSYLMGSVVSQNVSA